MEIPLRFRQYALLPTALVLLLMSFPLAVAFHDVVEGIVGSFTGEALSMFSWTVTIGAGVFWCVEIWAIYKFVQTGGFGFLD